MTMINKENIDKNKTEETQSNQQPLTRRQDVQLQKRASQQMQLIHMKKRICKEVT